MAKEKHKLKRELEQAVLFSLGKDPEVKPLEKIEHWQLISDFLLNHKLAGRFYFRLKERDLLHLLPEQERESLRQFYHLTAIKNKVLFTELARVWEELEREKVNSVLLKGTSLIFRGVYQAGERIQSDLDFLVSGINREQLTEKISRLGYLSVHHSDEQDWSEANFVFSWAKDPRDIFAVFLEFHWTFRPLNRISGEKLAQEILSGAEKIRRDSRVYQIPSPELQFYHSGLHGSVYHPFDSRFFWISLMDLSALVLKSSLNPSLIINLAQSQGFVEHLGVMSFLLKEKLGLFPELWGELSSRVPKSQSLIEQTSQTLWWGFLSPRPISLSNLIYLFSPTEPRNKRRAFLDLLGLRRTGERVLVEGIDITNPRPDFFSSLRSRLRTLDWETLKLIWQTAKFYRRVKIYFPWGA